MKNDSEDSQSQDTENERVLLEESGAEEDAAPSFASSAKPLLPTWYRRLMSAFRADLFACRHVDLARVAHRNLCIEMFKIVYGL